MNNLQCSDIFLCNSNRISARIVKFLMQEKTFWHWLYKKIFHKPMNVVRYYHAGMVITKSWIIEQQWKVQIKPIEKILNRNIIFYRYKRLNPFTENIIYKRANEDFGKIYDIPQLIGKSLTWITGIKLFTRLLGALSKEQEICVTRVGDWYWGICNFGVKTKHEITTKVLDEYCQNHPEEWEIVYEN